MFGFTGHEHLDEVGLIHMNGRVYDPRIGRFLSADPFVQNPESAQSYNRYSYLMNNPLSGSDPSGYFSLGDIFKPILKAIGVVLGAVVDAIRHPIVQQIGSIVVGVWAPPFLPMFSAFTTMINGGSFQDIILSGVASFAYAEALDFIGGLQTGANPIPHVEAVLLHGIVGGAMSAIQGGDFGSGFLSAVVGKAVTIGTRGKLSRGFQQGAVVALAGGITSVLGGGKFGNGAWTAAMGYVLNELKHSASLNAKSTKSNTEKRLSEFSEKLKRMWNSAAGYLKDHIRIGWGVSFKVGLLGGTLDFGSAKLGDFQSSEQTLRGNVGTFSEGRTEFGFEILGTGVEATNVTTDNGNTWQYGDPKGKFLWYSPSDNVFRLDLSFGAGIMWEHSFEATPEQVGNFLVKPAY